MDDLFAPFHLLVLLLIVAIVFGTGRLRKLGPDLGKAIRGFRQALNEHEDHAKPEPAQQPVAQLTSGPAHPVDATTPITPDPNHAETHRGDNATR